MVKGISKSSFRRIRKADLVVGEVEMHTGLRKKLGANGPRVVVGDDQQRAHGAFRHLLRAL